ncbi:hypothetical protein DLM78_09415 [Leptospira stimsonii]|uniref:Uncharacterized protein n=1 Tax=Leptospira stimsonii TaxID=2202203 RepID=A0A8B3CS97_9LEPT|nr:hypothetical protein DLM78_09415 [Leptospira stimsonii]
MKITFPDRISETKGLRKQRADLSVEAELIQRGIDWRIRRNENNSSVNVARTHTIFLAERKAKNFRNVSLSEKQTFCKEQIREGSTSKFPI